MPDPTKLTTASGQLGPKCGSCGAALIFSAALVIDSDYFCPPCYEEKSGASSATDAKQVKGLNLD